jgi:L-seryl-tRNA(Ser) seleniumtransferase
MDRRSLRPVVNATGVILHTNLGRAPLPDAAIRAAADIAAGYSSLEYDLESGGRGERYEHCEGLVCELTGSDAAVIVNNNAAAVSLAVNSLARGRDVVVSRGELVEIGGGFRVPDVIERSGGFLRAVGTTNRTRLDDYRRAIDPSTGLLLKVHPSNYRIEGFVEEASLAELVGLGRSAGLPVVHDLGSGLVLPDLGVGLPDPSVAESVSVGADLVTWSGDKLFGGPQAGIIHGRSELIDRLKSNPLIRAFRVDKMTLAALETTLLTYASRDRAVAGVPVLRMLVEPLERVGSRARKAFQNLSTQTAGHVAVRPMMSVVGGGSAPGLEIPSMGWEITGDADDVAARLREHERPVVGRVADGRLLLDFRTVLAGQEELVVRAVERCLGTTP